MQSGSQSKHPQIVDGKYKRRYVAEGFKEDAYKLLKTFSEGDKYDLVEFIRLWNDADMSLIYMGRTSRRELCEFTNECFCMTISLISYEDSSHIVRIGAVYLLYCLYGTQPFEKYKIRITYEAWKSVLQVLEYSKTMVIPTLAYAIFKLIDIPAIHFVGNMILMGPDVPINRSVALQENLLSVMVDQKWNQYIKNFWQSPLLQKYRDAQNKLENMKKAMGIASTSNSEFSEKMMKKLEMAANGDPAVWNMLDDNRAPFGDEANDEDDEAKEENLDIGLRRMALKDQQMNKITKPVQSIFQRSLGSDLFNLSENTSNDDSCVELCTDDPPVAKPKKKQLKKRRSKLSDQEKEMLDPDIVLEQCPSDSSYSSSKKSHRISTEEASTDDDDPIAEAAIFGEPSNSNRPPRRKSLRPRVPSKMVKKGASHSYNDDDDDDEPQISVLDGYKEKKNVRNLQICERKKNKKESGIVQEDYQDTTEIPSTCLRRSPRYPKSPVYCMGTSSLSEGVSDSDLDYEPGKVKSEYDCEFLSPKALMNSSKKLMPRKLSSNSRASSKSPKETKIPGCNQSTGKKRKRKRRLRVVPVVGKRIIKRKVGKGKKLKCHYNTDSADDIKVEDDPVLSSSDESLRVKEDPVESEHDQENNDF